MTKTHSNKPNFHTLGHLHLYFLFVRLFSMSDSAEHTIIEPNNFSEEKGKKLGLFLLPFVYFYFLSFVLLGVCSYMLVKNPIGVKSSFASEIENSTEDVKITLTKESEPQNEEVAFKCREEIAKKIDSYFSYRYINGIEGKATPLPLAGHGCEFDLHGQENNVDPIFVASIAYIESTGGKKTPKYQGIESYNPFGYGVYDDAKITADLEHHLCKDFNECIGRVTRAIRRNAEKRNISTEPSDVVTWYNPVSVRNASGIIENSSWFKKVTLTITRINTDENGFQSTVDTETAESEI